MCQPPLCECQTQGVGVLFTLPFNLPCQSPPRGLEHHPYDPSSPQETGFFTVPVFFGGYFELTSCHLEANFPPLTFTTSNLSPPALRFLLARSQ